LARVHVDGPAVYKVREKRSLYESERENSHDQTDVREES